MNWKNKINGFFDDLAVWLGLVPAPVPIPVREDPKNRRIK